MLLQKEQYDIISKEMLFHKIYLPVLLNTEYIMNRNECGRIYIRKMMIVREQNNKRRFIE